MCGICGVVYADDMRRFPEYLLTAMRDIMEHRGPDDAGSFIGGGIALASRRLSILDLSERGHMPMASADGRYWITYNGEIYNFLELRSTLEAKGHVFRSETDTEVLLHLFAERGPAMLDSLNGMFAFAIWDSTKRSLFVARDRLGIKPLCYAIYDNALYFASEEKALFTAGVPAAFDSSKWMELALFRYIAGENTPYSGIKRLLPGHYLLWEDGHVTTKRWWNLVERACALEHSTPSEIREWYRETFDSAVTYRRISDVPVGVMLSGGLDSSLVAASLALQVTQHINTFTVRFDEREYDEGPFALELAKQYGLEYHELRLSPTDELLGRLEEACWLLDAPLAHGQDPYILALARFARPQVTVLLSGEGADETMGGYVRYQPLYYPKAMGLLSKWSLLLSPLTRLNSRFAKLKRFVDNGPIEDCVLYNACDVLPIDLGKLEISLEGDFVYRRQILEEASMLYPDDFVRQAMYSDQHIFLCSLLDRNDRMTMGASIECRVPFLDYRLIEGLAGLQSAKFLDSRLNKALSRRSLGDRIPASIYSHRKWGFGVPWARYFREIPAFGSILRNLHKAEVIRDSPFPASSVQRIVAEFLAGSNQWVHLIREWLMVSIWHGAYFERLAHVGIGASQV